MASTSQPKAKPQAKPKISKLLIIFILIAAVIATALFAIYCITTAIRQSPLKYNATEGTAFDFPMDGDNAANDLSEDTTLEKSQVLPGEADAHEKTAKKKADIEDNSAESSASAGNSSNLGDSNKNSGPQSGGGTSTGNYWEYPAVILPCTRNGDDLLVLVNKSYQLPSTYAPSDLVGVETSGIRTTKSSLLLRSIMISSLTELDTAAKAQGIDLAILSAYRSYATQQSTYTYWVNYNGGSVAAADQVSARPGHSQHQLGTAVDFTTSEIGDALGQQFAHTTAGQWLDAHAWEYGFALAYPAGAEALTGYSYEPWHFRYIGKENASQWHDSGMTLEAWLRGKNEV